MIGAGGRLAIVLPLILSLVLPAIIANSAAPASAGCPTWEVACVDKKSSKAKPAGGKSAKKQGSAQPKMQ